MEINKFVFNESNNEEDCKNFYQPSSTASEIPPTKKEHMMENDVEPFGYKLHRMWSEIIYSTKLHFRKEAMRKEQCSDERERF